MLRSLSKPGMEAMVLADRAEDPASQLAERLRSRTAHVAVLGLGYAGLPMAVELARAGFTITGLDVDVERVRLVNEGRSPVSDLHDEDVAALVRESRLRAASRFEPLAEADCALICVPTPLSPAQEPDLRFVEAAARSVGTFLHPGLLVVLQSTCSVGTTRRVLLPAIEEGSELQVGEDFFLAFAPERIDPGNQRYTISNTPKLIAGITPTCTQLASLLFEPIVDQVVAVSSPEVAEMSKLVENTFRFINISFINEIALLCDRMGISVWEVVDAASTKPFAFVPHFPGPGIGGHCIPVVPFYLEAVAHEHGLAAELVEASARINRRMPQFVVDKLERLLAERGKALAGATVLLLGVAYKPEVADTRESPAFPVMELLLERQARVAYHDPYVPSVACRGAMIRSLTAEELARTQHDCAVLLTAHRKVDYLTVGRCAGFVLDTRNHLLASDGIAVVRL